MRRVGLLLALVSAAALAALVPASPPALPAVVGSAVVTTDPPADPFPLRRQFLPDDQLDRLTADPRGSLRKLSKAEFEAKVRAAADAQQLARTPPQVVSAAYRGRYEPGRITGSADWTVANTAGRPALLPLDTLRLAVTEFTPAKDRTALLFRGKAGGKELPNTYLWVGGERETTAAVGWSVRGVEEVDEERFDLGVPPAAIGTLELTMPADRLPVLTTGAGAGRRIDATGPFTGKADGERVWKWAVGGQVSLTLAVRAADTPGAAVTAGRTAATELLPGEVRSAFDFTLDSPRGLVRDLSFEVDAGVRVTGVSGDGVEGWKQEPAEKLSVKLREPAAAVKVRVTAVSPLPGGAVGWACPGVRAAGTLPAADSIDVTVSPELKLDGWAAGDYRPAVSGTTAKGTKLQFVGTFTAGDGPRRPPTVRVRSAEPELATDESLVWRVEPGRTRLTAAVKVKVVRGPLPQVVVRTAPGYTLESAALVPEDPAVTFGPLPGTPNAWVVEPSRAVPTGGAVEVRLDFRGPPGPPAPDPADPDPAAVTVPFPVFAPAGAVERQGTLTIIGERVKVAARTVLPTAPAPAGLTVAYRGKEPAGVGLFAPEPTAVDVDVVRLAVAGKVCEATVTGRADSPIGSLTLFVPHPAGQVKAAGAEAVPLPAANLLPLLTASSGWGAVAAAGTIPDGVYWRVTFPRPMSGPFEVTASYPAPQAADGRLVFPLPDIGGGRGDAGVELSRELAAVYHAEGPTADFPARVTLDPLAAPPVELPSGDWQLADVRQLNTVDGDGGLSVTLTGRVVTAAGRTLDLALPSGAEAESAQVGGKWVAPGETGTVRLPLPDLPAGGVAFEVRYRLPTPPLGPLPEYTSPPPGLPKGTGVRSRWEFAKGWLPWPSLAADDPCDGRSQVRAARGPVLRGVGFGLGGLLLAVGVGFVLRGGRVRAAALLGAVGGCGAAAWVASDGWLAVVQPPLFAGLGVLAVAALVRRPPQPRVVGRPSTRVIAATAILGVVSLVGRAQTGAEPAVVYVVGSDAQAVYAPPAVLDKLDALAAPPLPDVIVTRAEYTGVADESVATFDAAFTLECPRDGDRPFALPLAGVRLEAMTLDGKDAFPDASKQDRYGVVVKGKGPHTLTARFAVVPTLTGGEREARFGGPEVHVCRVTFDAGAKGRQPDVPTRRGGQTISGRKVTADHGAGRAMAVRWRGAAGDGDKPTLSVKEGAVWDATDTAEAGVWAAFVYRIDGGAADRFAVEVPAGLVPTRVLARPLDPRAVGVRSWTAGPGADGGTRVDVRLQQPADGRVLVLVRAVPARPLTATPVLRFPRAADVPDAARESVYAVRFPGVVGSSDRGGAVDVPAETLTKDFPPVPEFGFDKSPPARVVKRGPNPQAELRATLAPLPPFPASGMEVVFTVGGWAEVDGAVKTGAKEAGFVEFNVPEPIEVRDVRAAGLAGWGRSGNKVQAWLKQPAADVLVRWSGSLPTGQPTADLPLPRWSSAITPAEPTTVRVRAADGFTLQPVKTDGLKAKQPAAEGELAYTVEGQPPPPRFEVTPVSPADDKPAAPPAPRPNPPSVPPSTPAVGTPAAVATPPGNPWPVAVAVGWVLGLLAAVLLPSRWRPERVAAVGLLGVLAAGVGGPPGWCFAATAAVGILWRGWRVGRRFL